jgi:C_GCAxxG_C_C family probable redox protein
MNYVEMTIELNENGLNCSQAMLTVFGRSYGLAPETAKTMGRPLGGGLGGQSLTCGALTAAVLILGLALDHHVEKEARKLSYSQVKELFRRFEAVHGTTKCADLLGADMSTPEGMKRAREEKLIPKRCPTFIRNAASILAELLQPPQGADRRDEYHT